MRRVSIHRPRILPATIAVMAVLLVVKSVELIIEAVGGGTVEAGEALVSHAWAAPADTRGGEASAAAAAAAGGENAGATQGNAGRKDARRSFGKHQC